MANFNLLAHFVEPTLRFLDQVARTAPRKFSTTEDTGNQNPVTIARENLGAVYAT